MLDEYNFSEGVRGKYALRIPGGNRMTKKEIIELFRECFTEAREATGDTLKVNSTNEATERIALHLFDTIFASEIYHEVSEGMSERMFEGVASLLDTIKRTVGVVEKMSERLTKLEEGEE